MSRTRLPSDAIAYLFAGGGPGATYHDGCEKEVIGGAFPTQVIWWTAGRTQKIFEKIITRDANQMPTTVVIKVYDLDGTLMQTYTDSITYSGVFETTRTRVIS